jgi:hypothetical protein
MKTYAIIRNGEIIEYPITPVQAHNRSLPLHLLAPVVYGEKPNLDILHRLTETKCVIDGAVFVEYASEKLTIDQVLAQIAGIWNVPFYRGFNQAKAQLLSGFAKTMLEREIDDRLDTLAVQAGYRDADEMVSFYSSQVKAYQEDAAAMVRLRDKLWPAFYDFMEQAESRNKPYPNSVAVLLRELPALSLV